MSFGTKIYRLGALLLVAAVASGGCGPNGQSLWSDLDDSSTEVGLDLKQGPEALEWLKANKNESALASNRFLETPNAIRFVERLYAAGAAKVIVAQDSIQSDPGTLRAENGPYADALVVSLPTDPSKRAAVWKLCRAEIRREHLDPGESTIEDDVFLWWD